jgi:predicted MFS family arabinose efflux permease
VRSAPRWLKALLVGQAVSAAGALAWIYLTLYLVVQRGVAPHTAGLVAAAYGAGLVAGNLGGGSAGDRFGFKPALAGALAAWAAGCLAMPVTPTAALAPVGAAAGLAAGAIRPLMFSLVIAVLPAEHRREGIARSRAATNAGTVIGPPLGGLLAAADFGAVFVVDAVTTLALLAVVLAWVPAAEHDDRPADRPRGVLRALRTDGRLRLLLGSVLAVDTVYRLLYSVVPLLLHDLRAAAWVYGLTISLNCAVIVICEPRIARRRSGRPAFGVIALGYALVGLGFLGLGASPAVATVFAAVLIVTAGEMLYKPTATAQAADLAPPGMTGRYQSLYAGASVAGTLLSPLLGTAAYEAGPRLVWPAAALVALAAAGTVARRGRALRTQGA